MTKLFRLACSLGDYLLNPEPTQRPKKPQWLLNEEHSTRNQSHSFKYWTKIYWATPSWITGPMIDEMRWLYLNCPPGKHVDHIVPLTSNLVCGLHVPWNLQWLPDKTNLVKSNHMWPGHPCETVEMFPVDIEPYQMVLGL